MGSQEEFLNHSKTFTDYYKRPDVQRAICEAARDKEIDIQFLGYNKEKDEQFSYHLRERTVLKFPADIATYIYKRPTSFHASEELWINPLSVKTGMKKKELDALRTGWDLVIDIDCHELEYSKIAAHVVIEFFKHSGVKSISCKFSGNKGFHVGVPFEAFPSTINGIETKMLFPEAPKKIAQYMIDRISEYLGKLIENSEEGDFNTILEKTKLDPSKIIRTKTDPVTGVVTEFLDGAEIADIDTLLISSRHLYRMPYSFNEKSSLVSIPIPIDSVLNFSKEQAKPENVKIDDSIKFLDRDDVFEPDAANLLQEAYDYCDSEEVKKKLAEHNNSIFDKSSNDGKKISGEKQKTFDGEFEPPEKPIPEELFPPCVKKAFEGMEDGKKRALFALTNFFNCCGWEKEEIEKKIKEWNEKNADPIRETIVNGHLRYHLSKKSKVMPPNCMEYYQGIALCSPDKVCEKIKNPVSYALKKQSFEDWKDEQNKKEEQKKARAKARAEAKKKKDEKKAKSSQESTNSKKITESDDSVSSNKEN